MAALLVTPRAPCWAAHLAPPPRRVPRRYRALPQPLLPSSTFRQLDTKAEPTEQQQLLRAIVLSLPQPNLLNLHALCELLGLVVSCVAHNRMSAHALSLVFAPTISRAEQTNDGLADEMAEVSAAAGAISVLITARAECFPALPSRMHVSDATAVEVQDMEAGTAAADEAEAAESSDGRSSYSYREELEHCMTWWYSDAGTQTGPVSPSELAALLAGGKLRLSSWVFESGTADWQELSAVLDRLPPVHSL